MSRSISLPQVPSTVGAALELVCTVPAAGREERRASVQSVVDRATSVRELGTGVALAFDGSTETAKLVVELTLAERQCCGQFTYTIVFAPGGALELRVEASHDLVQPLKDLYVGLLTESRNV